MTGRALPGPPVPGAEPGAGYRAVGRDVPSLRREA